MYKSDLIDWVPQFLEIPKNLEYKDREYWQAEEALFFINDDINEPHLLACKLMLLYGFRPGEVYGLQENDIKNDVITINRSINDNNQITKGKNKNARRKELLTDVAKEVINQALEFKKKNKLTSEYVFANVANNHLTGARTYKHLRKYCKANNLTEISPYGLRHTFATLSKHHLTERQLKQIYGHSEAMNTDVYVHKLNNEELETGKVLNSFWNNFLNFDN